MIRIYQEDRPGFEYWATFKAEHHFVRGGGRACVFVSASVIEVDAGKWEAKLHLTLPPLGDDGPTIDGICGPEWASYVGVHQRPVFDSLEEAAEVAGLFVNWAMPFALRVVRGRFVPTEADAYDLPIEWNNVRERAEMRREMEAA